MSTIGQRIKHLRTSKNMTLQQIAEATNTYKGNISAYESDKYEPSAKTIVALSELFHVSTDWLLTGKTNNESEQDNQMAGPGPELESELLQIFNQLTNASKKEIVTFASIKLSIDAELGKSLTSKNGNKDTGEKSSHFEDHSAGIA